MSGTLRAGDQRGFALALALFAMVVMSALVAGSFISARLEQQSGRNTLFTGQAAEAAEAGLVQALSTISSSTLGALPIGGAPVDLGTLSFGAGIRVERQVSRLTPTLFLVRSAGARDDAAGGMLALRVLGRLVRLPPDPLAGPSSVTPLEQRSWAQLH